MKGTKLQSQMEEAIWASGLEKELVIDGYGFTHGSALLNDDKSSSCCFRSPAKLNDEPWGPQTGISDLLWNQILLQLPQTRSFGTDLQQRVLCNNHTDRWCSLTFSIGLKIVYFSLNFDSQRDPPGSRVVHNWCIQSQASVRREVSFLWGSTFGVAAYLWVLQVELLLSCVSYCPGKAVKPPNSPCSPIKKTEKCWRTLLVICLKTWGVQFSQRKNKLLTLSSDL